MSYIVNLKQYNTELRVPLEILEWCSSHLTPEIYITKETERHRLYSGFQAQELDACFLPRVIMKKQFKHLEDLLSSDLVLTNRDDIRLSGLTYDPYILELRSFFI